MVRFSLIDAVLVILAVLGPYLCRQLYDCIFSSTRAERSLERDVERETQIRLLKMYDMMERVAAFAGAVAPGDTTRHMKSIDSYFPNYKHIIRSRILRERYQQSVGPSFPVDPDGFRISTSPVRVRWDKNLDDYHSDTMTKVITNNNNNNLDAVFEVHDPNFSFHVDGVPSQAYQLFQADMERLKSIASSSSVAWGEHQTSQGACHFLEGDGYLCQVHRWDAPPQSSTSNDAEQVDGDIESGRKDAQVGGRLQCWTDDFSYTTDFLREHPEFDGKGYDGANVGYGESCILEVGNQVLVAGSYNAHDFVVSNHFQFDSSHGEGGWYLSHLISEKSTAVDTIEQLIEFSHQTIVSYGTY